MHLSAAQCRAARGLLNWTQKELANYSRVATKTIADFERGARIPHFRTLEALVKVFEAEGVVFLEETDTLLAGVAIRAGSAAADKLKAPAVKAANDDALEALPSDAAHLGTLF